MNSANTVIDSFAQKWNRHEAPTLAEESELLEVEAKLNANFPNSYRYFVLKYGDVYSPDILDKIVDKEFDLSNVQNFMLPGQAVIDTEAYEKAGMPTGYFAIASDSMGNIFCFKLDECRKTDQEPSVWFFDHDFTYMKKIFDGFDVWLKSYADL
jgi:hypothetical protein